MVLYAHMVSMVDSSVTLKNGGHRASIQKFTNFARVFGPLFTEIYSRESHIKHIFRFLSFTVICMLGSTYVFFIADTAGI